MAGPMAWCNWVMPLHLMAGAFPAQVDDRATQQTLTALLALGVNSFVCLQSEVDINASESAWRSGRALRCASQTNLQAACPAGTRFA